MSATRYPLQWPAGWKRTVSHQRKHAKFHGTKRVWSQVNSSQSWLQKQSLSVGDATARVAGELRRLGVREADWLISSNLRVRLDGLPYADQRNPDDVGVAVYFRIGKADRVLACDTWHRIADNLAAIAGHIEAVRMQQRYGVGTLDQAFTGYEALPPKGSTWRTTLGFAADELITADMVEEAFRRRAKAAHPDVEGGSHDAMASLTAAREEGRQELAGSAR